METQYLCTLIMAAEQGSFSRAAEKLHLTQSAVSQRIKNMEACCGVQLLDRSGPVLKPTSAGQHVLEVARQMVELEHTMLSGLAKLAQRQNLSVSCTMATGVAHMPDLLEEFSRLHPDVEDLRFLFNTPQEALDGLRAGEFDVAIVEHLCDQDFSTLRTENLPVDRMVFVGSPQLGIPAGAVALEQLYTFKLFTRRDGCSCYDLLCRNLLSVGGNIGKFKRVMMSDDYGLMCSDLLAVKGVAYVSEAVMAKHLRSGELVEYHVDGFNNVRQRSMVTRMSDAAPLVQEFMNVARKFYAQHA
ncbi:MAG: multiheme cytochrome-associated LysR family transcriptional regulator [Desulfuromonadaceae bacterium]|nr:LysR family transcriptional regulator [Geobacteraceae bacterium]